MPFSFHERRPLIDRLRSDHFDVLVVGGGVTGAGLARDAALRGLRVALVEMDDFSSGTSSRSSKLIHGGLRYLEQGDVGLVFEAVRERQRLMKLAPHLAKAQSFIVPVFKGSRHSVLLLDLGLTLYDMLAAGAGVIRHRAMRAARLLEHEPLLRDATLKGGVRYYDAQTDDVRLVMANLRDAHACGAVCVSRLRFEEPTLTDGRISGVKLKDLTTGETEARCDSVVLVAGPFADDAMRRFLGREPKRPIIRPSRVHIVLETDFLSEAILMTADDGRVVFALPWPHASVIGTTDTQFVGELSNPRCTFDDVDYLLACANSHLVAKGAPLGREDVVSTWSGIRPLAIGTRDDEGKTYNTSREHVIHADPAGLVMIAGGKLTTYRVMAAEGLEAAVNFLPPARQDGLSPCVTHERPLPGADNLPHGRAPLERFAQRLADSRRCSLSLAEHLTHTSGSDAEAVLACCEANDDGARQVVSGCPVRWGR